MRYRLLGASGLRVSEIFLGAMTFGEEAGPGASLEECRRILNAYAEAVGARRLDQLVENLGALNVELPPELIARLDASTNFEIGFPANFINGTSSWVYGQKGSLIDGRGYRNS
jgi:aryl-alcohol dehydrogenase-like predicted oxidoreductase